MECSDDRHSGICRTAVPGVAACLLWSTAFAAVKFGLQYAGPLGFAGFRFTLSGILVIALSVRRMKRARISGRFFVTSLKIAFFQTFILYGLFYMGIQRVPGAVGAVVVGSSPLFAALMAHRMQYGDKMTAGKAGSIGLGMAGVVLISLSRRPWSGIGFYETVGIMMLILASCSSACGNIIVSRSRGLDPFLLNGFQLFAGGTMLFIISIPVEGFPEWTLNRSFFLAAAWLVFIAAAAFSLWFYALHQPGVRVSELNLWKFLIPVFGTLFSWWLLPDESPTPVLVTGMVFVAFSVFYYFVISAREKHENCTG